MSWSGTKPSTARRMRASGPITAGLAAICGAALSLVFMVGALGVAVMFAASVAVVLVLATMLTVLSAAAWRVRPRPALAAKAGHAWVRYGAAPSRR